MRVVVLAEHPDAPRRWRVCPPRVAVQLRGADLILHAGDVCIVSVLAELAEYAPVVAVLGNNDEPDVAAWGAAETAELDLEGLSVAMVHDSGATAGRLVHAPPVPGGGSRGVRALPYPAGRVRLCAADLQPGIADGTAARQLQGTLGVLQIDSGRLTGASIVPVT